MKKCFRYQWGKKTAEKNSFKWIFFLSGFSSSTNKIKHWFPFSWHLFNWNYYALNQSLYNELIYLPNNYIIINMQPYQSRSNLFTFHLYGWNYTDDDVYLPKRLYHRICVIMFHLICPVKSPEMIVCLEFYCNAKSINST